MSGFCGAFRLDEGRQGFLAARQHGVAVGEQDSLQREVEQRLQRLSQLAVVRVAEPAFGTEPERLRRRLRLRARSQEYVADLHGLVVRKPVQDLRLAGGPEELDSTGKLYLRVQLICDRRAAVLQAP